MGLFSEDSNDISTSKTAWVVSQGEVWIMYYTVVVSKESALL